MKPHHNSSVVTNVATGLSVGVLVAWLIASLLSTTVGLFVLLWAMWTLWTAAMLGCVADTLGFKDYGCWVWIPGFITGAIIALVMVVNELKKFKQETQDARQEVEPEEE